VIAKAYADKEDELNYRLFTQYQKNLKSPSGMRVHPSYATQLTSSARLRRTAAQVQTVENPLGRVLYPGKHQHCTTVAVLPLIRNPVCKGHATKN